MNESAPVVTLLTQDDRRVACTLHRDPERDRPQGHPRGEVTYWRAVPAEEVELGTYEIEHTTPAHTAFWVDVPQPGLDSIRP